MIIFDQKKTAKIVTLLLVLLSIVQLAYYNSILPDQIVSHFNLKGQPDNWSNKQNVLFGHFGLIFFFASMFLFTSWLTFRLPDSFVNLPHKNYWLAPQRRKQTLDAVATFLIWIGNVVIIFFMVIVNLSYQVNLNSDQKSSNLWFALIIFLATIAYMIYLLFRRFHRIPLTIQKGHQQN